METKEIAEKIFAMPKWYASIFSKGKFMNAQTANRIKKRFRNNTLSFEMLEMVLNHHGYFVADKRWVINQNSASQIAHSCKP